MPQSNTSTKIHRWEGRECCILSQTQARSIMICWSLLIQCQLQFNWVMEVKIPASLPITTDGEQVLNHHFSVSCHYQISSRADMFAVSLQHVTWYNPQDVVVQCCCCCFCLHHVNLCHFSHTTDHNTGWNTKYNSLTSFSCFLQ